MTRLRVTEIFYSLQGESLNSGLPTVFVRLTGCPLRCGYCDTTYAFKGGHSMELEPILEQVAAYGVHHVTVTGGEPLAQSSCPRLLTALCDAGHQVSLETAGVLDMAALDPRVLKVMDLKTPGSGETDWNRYTNLDLLTERDQIKLVICNRADYLWAREKLREFDLPARCEVLFSAATGQQEPRELAEWILEDRLPVRFQLQLHKILWGDQPGR